MSKTVCIFAGARGKDYLFNDCAWIATELVKTGWDLIYGGSSKGVMGAVCKATVEAGGKITGVLPRKVYELNHYDKSIEMLVADTMAERKSHFWDKSDAFICLPGSYGSMDELFEVLTLTKLGYMPPKPIVIFNKDGFYNPLIDLFDNMVSHGLMPDDRAGLVKFCSTPWMVLDEVNKETT
jgi:uncharacterized protein (TIGR00730 family)